MDTDRDTASPFQIPKSHAKALDEIDLLLPSTSEPPNELRKRFDELARNWKDGTLVMSSSPQIYAHDAYRQIVDLGEQALPFVFSELRQSKDIPDRRLPSQTDRQHQLNRQLGSPPQTPCSPPEAPHASPATPPEPTRQANSYTLQDGDQPPRQQPPQPT